MSVDDRSRHVLWLRLDEALGEEAAATLMELLRPSYEALTARPKADKDIPAPLPATLEDDLSRQRLWRKLDQAIGSESAWTLIQLWDEAGRHRRVKPIRAA